VTIGGFVAELLGRVPSVDDTVVWKGYRFRVLKASARRAERIDVAAVSDGPEASGDGRDAPSSA